MYECFNTEAWRSPYPAVRYDGRRKEFRGISREAFNEAKAKHLTRQVYRGKYGRDIVKECRERRREIDLWRSVPYAEDFRATEADPWNDHDRYKRPASSGRGWCSICPGEPGNNWYTEDPILCAYLDAKARRAGRACRPDRSE